MKYEDVDKIVTREWAWKNCNLTCDDEQLSILKSLVRLDISNANKQKEMVIDDIGQMYDPTERLKMEEK